MIAQSRPVSSLTESSDEEIAMASFHLRSPEQVIVMVRSMTARIGRASFVRMNRFRFLGSTDADIGGGPAVGFCYRFDFKGAVDLAIKRTRSAWRAVWSLRRSFAGGT
jgi:hypothetical protein